MTAELQNRRSELAALIGTASTFWMTYGPSRTNDEPITLGKGCKAVTKAVSSETPIFANGIAPWLLAVDADDDGSIAALTDLASDLAELGVPCVVGPSGGITDSGLPKLHLWALEADPERRAGLDRLALACGLKRGENIRVSIRLPYEAHRTGVQPEWSLAWQETVELLTPAEPREILMERFGVKEKAQKPKAKPTRRPSGPVSDPALLRLLDETASATAERNNHLIRAALRAGSLVGSGKALESEVVALLMDAARQCGLPDKEAQGCIRRGIEKGSASPDVGGRSIEAEVYATLAAVIDTPTTSRGEDLDKAILRVMLCVALRANTPNVSLSLRQLAMISGASAAAIYRRTRREDSILRQYATFVPSKAGRGDDSSTWVVQLFDANGETGPEILRSISADEWHLVDTLSPSNNTWKSAPTEVKEKVTVRNAGQPRRNYVRSGSLRPGLRAMAEQMERHGGWQSLNELTQARKAEPTPHHRRQTSTYARELLALGLVESKEDREGRLFYRWLDVAADAAALHEQKFIAGPSGMVDPETRRRAKIKQQQRAFASRIRAAKPEPEQRDVTIQGAFLVDAATGEVIGQVDEPNLFEGWDELARSIDASFPAA